MSRDAYDKAYEEIFGGKKPKKRKKAKRQAKPRLTQMDPCDIAGIMEPERTNWRRA